jgi:hypothetical protein
MPGAKLTIGWTQLVFHANLTAVQNSVILYGRRSSVEKTKLTIRLPRDLLEGAKQYAKEHDTTLTRLVSEYLRRLSEQDSPLAEAPTVRRLSGILSPDASLEDYRRHLENKYDGQT